MFIKAFVVETIKKASRDSMTQAIKHSESKGVVREKLGFDTIDEFMKASPEELKNRKGS